MQLRVQLLAMTRKRLGTIAGKKRRVHYIGCEPFHMHSCVVYIDCPVQHIVLDVLNGVHYAFSVARVREQQILWAACC